MIFFNAEKNIAPGICGHDCPLKLVTHLISPKILQKIRDRFFMKLCIFLIQKKIRYQKFAPTLDLFSLGITNGHDC
jgi:hypothetical protein